MDNAEQSSFFSEELMEEILKEIYDEQKDKADEKYVNKKLFERTKEVLNEAVDEGYGVDTDKVFADKLKHSTDVLSTFKAYEEGQAIVASAMYDKDGNLASFGEYRKKAKEIAPKWQENWLRTEYDTAVIRSRQAAEWEQFKENADVMPNLRWMPTSSATPREQHKVYWANELTLPVDDDFWNSHRPGDLWNCKCWLMQTDEPATKAKDIPTGGNVPKPAKGLKGNPGKTGEVFSADHNLFPDSCANCFLNRDGKVHGISGVFDDDGDVKKGNCAICREANCKARDLMSHETTDKDIETLINNGVKVQVKAETINKSAIGGVNLVKLFNDVESVFDKFEIKLKSSIEVFNKTVSIKFESEFATIFRRFEFKDGKKIVEHQYFEIAEEYQKKGIATNVNKALYYSYKESNTNEIRLTAEKSGSYVWAKQGFYNRDPYNVIKYIEEDNNKSSYAETYRKAVDDFYKKHNKSEPFPMKFLTKLPMANVILKDIPWEGFIDLNNVEMCQDFDQNFKSSL